MEFRLPFTMTRANGLGIFAFLYEYLDGHWESTSADFRCVELNANIAGTQNGTEIIIEGRIWLAPYEMRVSQGMRLSLKQKGQESLFEVLYCANQLTGELNSWNQANYIFLDLLN